MPKMDSDCETDRFRVGKEVNCILVQFNML